MTLAEFLLDHWEPASEEVTEKSLLAVFQTLRWVSLADMNNYNVWQLNLGISWLKEFHTRSITMARGDKRDQNIIGQEADPLRQRISYARTQLSLLELDGAVDQADKMIQSLKLGWMTWNQIHHDVGSLFTAIEARLPFRRFAYVPMEKAKRLDGVEGHWAQVLAVFPEARDDIRAATECYALDVNTACVFHSMRIAEYGLRRLARKLGLTKIGAQKAPLEFAEWGQILSAMRGALNAAQQSPGRSHRKSALTKFYADASSHADYLNEIWRKEVSHARGPFNAPEALNALMRTQAFMELLCERIKPKAAKP